MDGSTSPFRGDAAFDSVHSVRRLRLTDLFPQFGLLLLTAEPFPGLVALVLVPRQCLEVRLPVFALEDKESWLPRLSRIVSLLHPATLVVFDGRLVLRCGFHVLVLDCRRHFGPQSGRGRDGKVVGEVSKIRLRNNAKMGTRERGPRTMLTCGTRTPPAHSPA